MLQLKYNIPVEGAKRQGTRRATRRHCALAAALAAMARGDEVESNVVGGDLATALVAEFLRLGVPAARAALWARGINHEEKPEYLGPNTVAGLELSTYQKDAISTLGVAGGILALDTGLGKTLCATAAAINYARHGHAQRCHIYAPVNALGAWLDFAPVLSETFQDFGVFSIDSLHKLRGLEPGPGGVLIADEVHLLGQEAARRTKLAHELRRCYDVGLGLTGTLTTGGVEKAFSSLDLAVPGAALFSSTWTLGDHFQCLVRKEIPGRGTVTSIEKPTKDNLTAFYRYLDRFVVNIKKHSEVAKEAGIPAQHKHTVDLDDGKSLDDCVVHCAQQYMAEHDGELPHASKVLSMLRCEGLDAKLLWLYDEVHANDDAYVLAAWSKETLGRLREIPWLQSHVYVDGSVTGKARVEAVRALQCGEVRYYIGQMDASCVSVNLHRAWKSVTLELTNRATNYEQFLGRTARRGQTHECHHYDVVTNAAQKRILTALRRGLDFDAKFAEYQEIRNALNNL